jgi:hypothetical protein
MDNHHSIMTVICFIGSYSAVPRLVIILNLEEQYEN